MREGTILQREHDAFVEKVMTENPHPFITLSLFYEAGFNRAAELIEDLTCGCGSFATLGDQEISDAEKAELVGKVLGEAEAKAYFGRPSLGARLLARKDTHAKK